MAENKKTPLTFEDIKKIAGDNSEMNMLMEGKTYGADELLTPASYVDFLVQLRAAKGQSANSIHTESQLKAMELDLPKYDFAFYNDEGEKCYDLALVSNKKDAKKELNFEDTLSKTLESNGFKLNSTKPDVDFENFNKQMSKVFGIGINTDTKYSVYDRKIFRTIGRKIINLVAGRDGRVKSAGTLFIQKPNFEKTKESEYYRNCIVQYTDLLAEQTTSISFSDYKAKLLESPEFKKLSKEEQKQQLKEKQELFKGDKEVFNSIVRDLVASEMVKTMPSLSAKMRYELNQAYILRACQSLASLDKGFSNDTIIMKAIQDVVKQPILKFNQRLNLTPEKVVELNAQVLQSSPKGTKTLEDAIFGSKQQLYVKEFGYRFTPEQEKKPTPEADANKQKDSDATSQLNVTADRFSTREQEKNPTPELEPGKKPTPIPAIPTRETGNGTQTHIEDFTFNPDNVPLTPTVDGNGEEAEVTPAAETPKEQDGSNRATDQQNGTNKKPTKPIVKNPEEVEPTYDPPFVRDEKTVNISSLSEDELKEMVDDYIDIRINKSLAHLAKYAESNGKTRKEIELLENVRDAYKAGEIADNLTEKEIYLFGILNRERERFVSHFMVDFNGYKDTYEQGKNNGEWLEAKSIPALLKKWISDPTIDDNKKYQKGLKTFRGNYERCIRIGVDNYMSDYSIENNTDELIK